MIELATDVYAEPKEEGFYLSEAAREHDARQELLQRLVQAIYNHLRDRLRGTDNYLKHHHINQGLLWVAQKIQDDLGKPNSWM